MWSTAKANNCAQLREKTMKPEIYDLIGIGVGPFNLSLAALSSPLSDLKMLFVDSRPKFDWHPGMLLDSASLQTPFMSDLVTMADPTSQFSYLNFAKQTGKLYSFYIRENFFLPRQEYNQYCQWVCRQLNNLKFNFHVENLEYEQQLDCYRVSGKDKVTGKVQDFYCKHLVLGTGTQPWLPEFCPTDKHITHSSQYLNNKAMLQSKSDVTIVGSGQSAAEIFHDLLLDIDKFGYQLRWLTRSPRFFPLEYTKLTLEMTSPEYIDYFHDLPNAKRQQLIHSQKSLYKGINSELINDIYDLLYQKKLNCDFSVELLTNTSLTNIKQEGQKLALSCLHNELEQDFSFNTNALVMATGYQYQLPNFIEPLRHKLNFDENGELQVKRNYNIDEQGRIFAQNLGLNSHGLTAPDLGMACYRNAIILKQVLGKAPYSIEERIAFQQFGIPKTEGFAPSRSKIASMSQEAM